MRPSLFSPCCSSDVSGSFTVISFPTFCRICVSLSLIFPPAGGGFQALWQTTINHSVEEHRHRSSTSLFKQELENTK